MRPRGPAVGDYAGGEALEVGGYLGGVETSEQGEGHQPPAAVVTNEPLRACGKAGNMRKLSAEVTSMRSILVGVVAAVVAVGSPAFGGGVVDDPDLRPGPAVEAAPVGAPPVAQEHYMVNVVPPFRDVVVEEDHSAGAEWGMGVASTVLSLFYTPVRLVVGIVGAGLGGVEGWLTGGDLRTARSMWRPTVEGDYFIRPDHLDRTEHYEFSNVRPVARERYTIRGREPVVVEEHEQAVAVAPVEGGFAVVEPELEDNSGNDR